MSVWSRLRRLFQPVDLAPTRLAYPMVYAVKNQTAEDLYRTQPQLQRVIKFRARNVAQIGLHAFHRTEDTDRNRASDSVIAKVLRRPNPDQTLYEVLDDLVSNLDLYGVAYWLVVPDAESPTGWQVRPVPPAWIVSASGGSVWAPAEYEVNPGNGKRTKIKAEDLIVFRSWAPGGSLAPLSPIEALKDVLAEQIEAWQFRRQLWERGGRVGNVLMRPADAPQWTEQARNRFIESWQEFQAGGARAGSTPLLEDGVKLERAGFSAREEEWAESAKLSLETVAGAYHVDPAMIGDSAGMSNASVRELRSMLYTETLGPLLKMIEDRLTAFLVPKTDPDSDIYLEFNIEAKLQGNFEEQARILSTSTGAPWMTINEARAIRNLPAVEGGDELIVPLNVVRGGQASPQDGGTPSVLVENQRDHGEAGQLEPGEEDQ